MGRWLDVGSSVEVGNAVAFEKYKEDKAGTLAKAEKNWPPMHHRPVTVVNS